MVEDVGILGLRRRGGASDEADRSESLCDKVLLKYKKETASDTDIRSGQKEGPPTSL